MLRLFISFYLAVILSILVINLTTEYVWDKLHINDDTETLYATEVASSLQQILLGQANIKSIPDNVEKAELIQISDIAWMPFQLDALNRNEPVVTFDANKAFYVNMSLGDYEKILRLGPYYPSQNSSLYKWLILTVSYIALAILLAIWIRPLWRDLQQLANMASTIASGNLDLVKIHSKRSAITPLVNTMHAMAARIIRLVSDQKQLVNSVSHELRTPIARLRFAVAMLDNIEAQQKKEINDDLFEMEQLINEMLNYARLESQATSLTKSRCDLTEIISAQVDKLRRQTPHKIIFAQNQKIEAIVNAQSIERVVQNLLTNAIRYANSTIEVAIIDSHSTVSITVDDDGPGIAPAHRQEIFTPFHTIDESRSKNNAGFGLGLAIVKRMLEWHSGTCEITTSPKNGCRFSITLPKQTTDHC